MRIIGCLLFLIASQAFAQFSPKESQIISDALGIGNYSVEDLQFARQSGNPPFALELCGQVLGAPITGAESVMALHGKADVSTQKMLSTILSECFKDSLPKETASISAGQLKNAALLPQELQEPVGDLVSAIGATNAQIKDALSKLTPDEKRLLIESLPQWAAVGTDIQFEFVTKPKMTLDAMYAALAKVNLAEIRAASLLLDKEVQEALPKLRLAAASGWKSRAVFSENGVNVEICGVGDDLHESKNTNLCIDLGGRNRYTGRYGAGIGYASVLIDLGNDIKSDFPDASAGVGVLGVGMAFFEGSRPDLIAKNIAFGAGLAGVGEIKVDQAFRMECRSIGQGFGMCGVGLLIGSKGTDTQKIGYLGQGAGMLGGVGWLFNPAGNDRYRAGGLVPDGVSQNGFISRAQGYSGIFPGGIGLLTDNAGDDLYEAGTEAQGCASGLGIASLYDLSGNDAYFAQRQAQAYAESEGCALLFDLGGDDVYMVRENQCHAFAIDRSFAMVLDRSGNDVVAAHDSQPATAQEGSIAIYLDAEGSDTFTGPVGVGVQINGRFGIGVFVDYGGDSRIAVGPGPGSAVFKEHSIAFNGDEGTGGEPVPAPKAGTVKASDEEIDVLWESVQAGGKGSLESSRKLNGIGLPAFVRFCSNFASRSNNRAKRVAANILVQVPEAHKVLADKAATAPEASERALFEVATQAKATDLKSLLSSALQSDSLRRIAVRYAATINATEYVDQLSGIVLSGDSLTSQEAVIAIAKLGDEKLVPTMESLMLSKDIIVRDQAINFLAKYPRGLSLGKQFVAKTDERSQILGVSLLGAIGTEDSLRLAGAALNSPLRAVKIKAMTTLSGRVPEFYRARIVELTKDQNPIVAAVAKGVDIGR